MNNVKAAMLHHVREADIARLEEVFAVLTEDGWVIPAWLILMRETAQLNAHYRSSDGAK